jgi:hypothetical protein
VLDVPGMAHTLRPQIDDRLQEAELRLANEGDPDAQQQLRAEIARLRGDQLELADTGHNARSLQAVRAIAANHGLDAPDQHTHVGTTSEEVHETEHADGGISRVTGSERTTTRLGRNPTVGSLDSTTTRDTRSLGVGREGLSRGSEHSVADERADGSSEHSSQRRRYTLGAEGHGVGLSRRDDSTHAVTETNGSTTEVQQGRARGISVGSEGIGLHRSHDQSRSEHNSDGSSSQQSQGSTSGVSVGREGVTASNESHSRSSTTDASGHTSTRESSQNISGGVITGREHGAQMSFGSTSSSSESEQRDGQEHQTRAQSSSTSGSARLTDHGGAASLEHQAESSRGPVTISGHAGVHGSFTIEIEHIEDSHDVNVITRVEISGSAGGGLGVSGGGVGVNAGVDASTAHGLTITRRMSAAEATRYAERARTVDRGGGDSGADLPELGLIARLRASGAQGAMAALDDPAAAAQMGVGSSLELSSQMSGDAHGGVSASGGGLGGSLSAHAGASQTRTVHVGTIELDGQRLIEVRLTFSTGHTSGVSGSAQASGVAMEAGQEHAREAGHEVVFHLDPSAHDYAQRFHRIMATDSEAAAQALGEQLGAEVTQNQSSSDGTSVGVGGAGEHGGVGFGIRGADQHDTSSSVTLGAGGGPGPRALSGTSRGESTQSGSVGTSGHTLASMRSDGTATSTVDRHGNQSLDMTHTEQSDIDALPQAMRNLLHTTFAEVERFHLDAHGVEQLAATARDPLSWSNVLTGTMRLHFEAQWLTLGRRLVAPQPDPAWVAANPQIAVRIARGRAISDFVAAAPAGEGQSALELAVRGPDGRAEVGERLMWPDGISGRAEQFQHLRERLDNAEEHWPHTPIADVLQQSNDIQMQLEMIRAVVTSCDTYSDATAKVETLAAVRHEERRVEELRRRALDQQTAHAPDAAAPAAATTGPGAAPPAGAQHDPPSAHEGSEQQRTREQLEDLIAEASDCKEQEMAKWHESQREAARAGGWFDVHEHLEASVSALQAIAAMYPRWVDRLQRAYHLARTSGGDTGRLTHLHPNVEWTIQLYREALNNVGSMERGTYEDDFNARTPQWREEARVDTAA